MQAFVFLVFFASQICLLELFVQKMFFDDLDVVKTSMNFEQMSDIQYPQITICRSFPYDKQELKSNQNSILGVFISWLKNYIHRDVAYFTSQKSSVISYLNNSILKFENNTNILQWASIFHTYYNEPWNTTLTFIDLQSMESQAIWLHTYRCLTIRTDIVLQCWRLKWCHNLSKNFSSSWKTLIHLKISCEPSSWSKYHLSSSKWWCSNNCTFSLYTFTHL